MTAGKPHSVKFTVGDQDQAVDVVVNILRDKVSWPWRFVWTDGFGVEHEVAYLGAIDTKPGSLDR